MPPPSESASSIVQGEFTHLASAYVNRPGYSVAVLRMLGTLLDAERRAAAPVVADVGAGTGKLTLDLYSAGYAVASAVEPNDAMRAEGMRATAGKPVKWLKGSGEQTTLPGGSADWILMGSSFHWVDLKGGLAEFHRVLRPGGIFTALWNPRDIDKSPLHAGIERRIREIVPDLKRVSSGGREYTLDLSSRLVSTGEFTDVMFVEAEYALRFSRERYLGAWRSVNDIQAQAGPERFARVMQAIEAELGDAREVDVPYKTRAWTVRRK